MQLNEDFEKGVGTYLKIVRFMDSPNPDGFVVLYLRPSGRFLFAGYWSGYERSVAVGRWLRQGAEIRLEGSGRLESDVISGPDGGRFRRVFTVGDSNHTPFLIASDELKGWSLLGWKGPLAYVGRHTIIDPDHRWLPESMAIVDTWIDEAAGA